jgi:hypothetical protein
MNVRNAALINPTAIKMDEVFAICTEGGNFRAPDFDVIKEGFNPLLIFCGGDPFEAASIVAKSFESYAIRRGLSVVG